MPISVRADFRVPVGFGKGVATAAAPADFSDDFNADFARGGSGMMAIEAGKRLYRGTATAAEAKRATRAGAAIRGEAASSVPANARLGLTNAADLRRDARSANEIAASARLGLLLPAGWIAAQRRENMASTAETLRGARVDLVVIGEGSVRLCLDPNLPTEQGLVIAAPVASAAAESAALLFGAVILPGESVSGAAVTADALLAIETLSIAQVDSPARRESSASSRGGMAGLEALLLSRADGAAPFSAVAARFFDVPLAVESAALAIGDSAGAAEALVAVPGGFEALLESLTSSGVDAGAPAETAMAVTRTIDATLPVEILAVALGGAPAAGESWGTYVIRITLTLSDGRVLTFATTAIPTPAS